MLSGGYSWRLFFYVEFAFAVALLVGAFFFVEESMYKRQAIVAIPQNSSGEKMSATEVEIRIPEIPRKTWAQQLKVWNGIDREAPFFMTMLRCFTYLLVPSMFW